MRRKLLCVHLSLLFLATCKSGAKGLLLANHLCKTGHRRYAAVLLNLLKGRLGRPVRHVGNKQIILISGPNGYIYPPIAFKQFQLPYQSQSFKSNQTGVVRPMNTQHEMPTRSTIHMNFMTISSPILPINLEDHSTYRTADLRNSRELPGALQWVGQELGVPVVDPLVESRDPCQVLGNSFRAYPVVIHAATGQAICEPSPRPRHCESTLQIRL